MVLAEFEEHVRSLGYAVEDLRGPGGQTYVVIRGIPVPGGRHAGKLCDVAVIKDPSNPWIPTTQLQVRPHLTAMGQRAANPSPLGPEWQYLSRRFDRPPNPRTFYAHVLSVLSEF